MIAFPVIETCAPLTAWSEGDRLGALNSYRILDTPREDEFDDLVHLAAQICGAPMSTITFVASTRQWFKAEVGMGARETPRDISLCSYAITQPEDVFVVPDTTRDERFRHYSTVVGDPHLRFYAGALLKTKEGIPLGTLCVLDTTARPLPPDQAFALRVLARQIMTQLELRRSVALLKEALGHREAGAERVQRALDSSATVGIWEWDLVKNRVFVDERYLAAFGGEQHWVVDGAAVGEYVKAIHPDDLPRFVARLAEAQRSGTVLTEEYRLRQKDGAEKWIEARGKCEYDKAGTALRFPGVAVDITSRRLADEVGV